MQNNTRDYTSDNYGCYYEGGTAYVHQSSERKVKITQNSMFVSLSPAAAPARKQQTLISSQRSLSFQG